MNMMTSYSHLLDSSTKIPTLIPDYYNQWADRMEDYLNGIAKELWNCIIDDVHLPSSIQSVGTSATYPDVIDQTARLQKNEKRCLRELRGALHPVSYNYVQRCKTSKEIWNK